METDVAASLKADLAAAEADVKRIRAENAELAEAFRTDPTDEGREVLKRAAKSLAAARERIETARAAIHVFDRIGSAYGLLAENGRIVGTIAVLLPPGTTKDERAKAIDDALSEQLTRAADELGVVIAAAPGNYTLERPGRDAEGRTILEVAGRVEGDRVVPAVSRAAKNLKN